MLSDYREKQRATLQDAGGYINNHLAPVFAEMRCDDLATPDVKAYVRQRLKEGAKNATVNRELAILKRAFRLGYTHYPPKVDRLPNIFTQGMKESDLQRSILDYLALKEYAAFKVPSGGVKIENRFVRMAKAGTSDIIDCSHAGRFIAIEVKMNGRKPTPEQLEFLDSVHRANGIGIVAYSMDEVMKAL